MNIITSIQKIKTLQYNNIIIYFLFRDVKNVLLNLSLNLHLFKGGRTSTGGVSLSLIIT